MLGDSNPRRHFSAICFRLFAWIDILAFMHSTWRSLLRDLPAPITVACLFAATAGLIVYARPDDLLIIGITFFMAAVSVALLVMGVFYLVAAAFRVRLSVWRLMLLGLPALLYVLMVLSLLGTRSIGPLTPFIGIAMMLLAQYVLWPRKRHER